MDAEVVVVGAGPVGGLAARHMSRKGLSVLLLEEHGIVGRPVHCAGLVGIQGLHGNGVHPNPAVIIGKIRRSILHAPSGLSITFDKKEPHAYVLHRDRLDQQIVQEAEKAGTTVHMNNRVIGCERDRSGLTVKVRQGVSQREFKTQVLLDAEGVSGQLARQLGLPGPNRSYLLSGLQYEISNVSLPTDAVHLFLDSKIAPGFFVWLIPLSDHWARVGLATAHGQARQALDKFLSQTQLIREAKVETRFGGLVYTGGPVTPTVAERVVVVGDAAGQTKATSGGGVVTGGACAIIAASHIHQALQGDSYHHADLVQHEHHWKRVWGRSLCLMAMLRRFINTMTNNEIDYLFANLQNQVIRDLVETKGDIDQQADLIVAAFTNPVLLANLSRLFISKIRYLPRILWG